MLDWIKNSPQSIYALLGDYGMGKTFSCRILSAKLTEEEGAVALKHSVLSLLNTVDAQYLSR
jgi:ABC-type sugar transport system ATPase subunit